jgi:hypothetical protein
MVVVPSSHRSTLVRKRGTLAEPRIHACNGSRTVLLALEHRQQGYITITMVLQDVQQDTHNFEFFEQNTNMGESGSRADGVPAKMKALQ